MERRVGKIFAVTTENIVYKCKVTESSFSCRPCAFNGICNKEIKEKYTGACGESERKDGKYVVFQLIKSKNITQ